MHLRLGDYKKFTVLRKSTLFPISYYKNMVDYFMKSHSKCFFIFLSDEPEYIKQEFRHIDNKKISKNNRPRTDLAIINKCKAGILSPSSFSWWGAYLIKNKGIIIAPKYWLGFNSGIEFPKGGFPSFAKKVTI